MLILGLSPSCSLLTWLLHDLAHASKRTNLMYNVKTTLDESGVESIKFHPLLDKVTGFYGRKVENVFLAGNTNTRYLMLVSCLAGIKGDDEKDHTMNAVARCTVGEHVFSSYTWIAWCIDGVSRQQPLFQRQDPHPATLTSPTTSPFRPLDISCMIMVIYACTIRHALFHKETKAQGQGDEDTHVV